MIEKFCWWNQECEVGLQLFKFFWQWDEGNVEGLTMQRIRDVYRIKYLVKKNGVCFWFSFVLRWRVFCFVELLMQSMDLVSECESKRGQWEEKKKLNEGINFRQVGSSPSRCEISTHARLPWLKIPIEEGPSWLRDTCARYPVACLYLRQNWKKKTQPSREVRKTMDERKANDSRKTRRACDLGCNG